MAKVITDTYYAELMGVPYEITDIPGIEPNKETAEIAKRCATRSIVIAVLALRHKDHYGEQEWLYVLNEIIKL